MTTRYIYIYKIYVYIQGICMYIQKDRFTFTKFFNMSVN